MSASIFQLCDTTRIIRLEKDPMEELKGVTGCLQWQGKGGRGGEKTLHRRNIRVTRRHTDIFRILALTQSWCVTARDRRAEEELNVKETERMVGGREEPVEGRIEEEGAENVPRSLQSLLKCPLARQFRHPNEAAQCQTAQRWAAPRHEGVNEHNPFFLYNCSPRLLL